MTKKTPELSIVPSGPTWSSPPPSLGEVGAKLWRSIMSEYKIDDSPGLATLEQVCAAADRAADCAEIIARDGATISTRQGLKDHPLLKHELAARSFVTRGLHRLNLDVEPRHAGPGRPPGVLSRTR